MTVRLHLRLHSSGFGDEGADVQAWEPRAFEWFCHCSPSLSVRASGDVISEDGGTSVHYNCLWQASSHWCLSPKLSCQFFLLLEWTRCLWRQRIIKHQGFCTLALAWHVANGSLSFSHRSYLRQGQRELSSVIERELIMIASQGILPTSRLSSLPASIFFTIHSLIQFYFITLISFYIGHIGMWHTEKGHMNAWNRNICKSALSYNPAVITRGTKERCSHETAPLKTGMSRGTFQIIPVSQNNTMTHKYHPTSEWTKVNIRYKALNIASPTHFLFILHTWQNSSYIFLPNLILS